MAVIQPGVWGIDLGQCALKALRLEKVGDEITATAFDYVEHPKILSQPDADADQLIREALEKFLSRNDLGKDMVVISVPGQSGLARFVKLPPVEEKKIQDIVRFEAKQQIPFNLEEVVWDYQKIGSGMVSAEGFAMDTEIGLFAMKRDMISRYLQHFKEVNIEVHLVQMAPLALCNFVSHDLLTQAGEPAAEDDEAAGKKRCVVALDIGADNSNLVITDGDRIIWQRPIPLGGNHFTRALTKELKLTFAKAEHLKRNATKSPDLKKILAALKPVLNDFVGEVQRSLGYFTNTHRNAHVAYLVGLGNAFRLPGMQRFLSEKLQLEVRKLPKMERLTGDGVVSAPVFVENIASFAVAYGLALQGLKATRLQTNLLPPEIRVERLIRAKKPWAVTAAAALLLGVLVPMIGYGLQWYAHGATSVQKEREQGAATAKQVRDFGNTVSAAEGANREHEEAIRAFQASQEERLNWLRLNKFIADCLPRPDGSNVLYPKAQDTYAKESTKAFKELPDLERKLQNALREPIKTPEDDKTLRAHKRDVDLAKSKIIQFNIESIDTRFVKDPGNFLEQLKTAKADIGSLRHQIFEKEKPEGPVWVVELRGFTDHFAKRAGDKYVIELLVENIAHKGAPAAYKRQLAAAKGGGEADAAKPEEKKSDDPVVDRVSHVVLIKAGGDALSTPSVLDQLAAGSSTAGQGGGDSGTAAPGPGRGTRLPEREGETGTPDGLGRGFAGGSGWLPLISIGGAGSGALPKSPPDPSTIKNPGESGTAAPPPAQAPSQTIRTEFVIVFLWKEPLKAKDPGTADAGGK